MADERWGMEDEDGNGGRRWRVVDVGWMMGDVGGGWLMEDGGGWW